MLFNRSPWVLALILTANGLAYSFFAITAPSLGRVLQFKDSHTGLILGISALIITLVSPIWGKFCERWGRRRVLLSAIIATTLFNFFTTVIIYFRLEFFVSTQLALMMLFSIRILNSLFTAGLKPAAQAQIADITCADSRAQGMGLMGAAFGIGTIGGGFVATLSGIDHLISAYLLVSLVLFITSIVAITRLEETKNANTNDNKKATALLPYRKIWKFILITFLGLTLFSQLQHIVALTLQDRFLLDPDKAIRLSGFTMMITMLTMIITQGILLRWIALSPKTLIITGSLISMVAMLGAALAPIPIMLIISIALFGFGLGLLFPGNLAGLSISVSANQQAYVAGINGIGQGLGLAAGPVLGVALHKFAFVAPYFAGAIIMTLLFFTVLFDHKKTSRHA